FRMVVPMAQEQFATFALTSLSTNIMNLVSATDETVTKNAPWKLLKSGVGEDKARAASILRGCYEAVRVVTALLYPILPFSAAIVWSQLGLGDIELAAKNGELNNLEWGGLKPGTKLGTLGPIFPRAPKELADIMADIEEKNATA